MEREENIMKKSLVIMLLVLCLPVFLFAEIIVLKNGKTVEGIIIEKTDKYVKIDFQGVPITYYNSEIESVSEAKSGLTVTKKAKLSQEGKDTVDCKDEHVSMTDERMQASINYLSEPKVDFREIIRFLQEDKFQAAAAMLNQRIATLKNMWNNKWVIYDHQPRLGDCLILSCYLNLYLDNIKGAEADVDYLVNDLKMSEFAALKNKIQSGAQQAKQKPEEWKKMLKDMSETIWLSKDLKPERKDK